jgi:hypothetical protein
VSKSASDPFEYSRCSSLSGLGSSMVRDGIQPEESRLKRNSGKGRVSFEGVHDSGAVEDAHGDPGNDGGECGGNPCDMSNWWNRRQFSWPKGPREVGLNHGDIPFSLPSRAQETPSGQW